MQSTEAIDRILEELAGNNNPVSIMQISSSLGIPAGPCYDVLKFLQKYGFVDREGLSFKLGEKVKSFIFETKSNKEELSGLESNVVTLTKKP